MAESSDNTNYFRGYYNVSPGINDVGSFQVSGIPYVTGSTNLAAGFAAEQRISFPAVTKQITIKNISTNDKNANLLVSFSSAKDAGNRDTFNGLHFITLFSPVADNGNANTLINAQSEITLDAKVKEIFIQAQGAACSWQLYASLTGIMTANMPPLSGSGINLFDPTDNTTP